MSNDDSILDNENNFLKEKDLLMNVPKQSNQSSNIDSAPKWINNKGEEVKQVFGFNENAELVNGRLAMIGFLMLLLTELAFSGTPATQAIFGIN